MGRGTGEKEKEKEKEGTQHTREALGERQGDGVMFYVLDV
jgi:hypothetical protein